MNINPCHIRSIFPTRRAFQRWSARKIRCLALFGCLTTALWSQPALNWDRTLGGASWDELNGLLAMPDGIIAAGSSRSGTTDLSWNYLIVKLDFDGNVIWQRTYGGDQDDRLWAIIPTADGGFLAGGYSYSSASGNKSQPTRGDMDVWVMKLDAQGMLQWERAWGGLYRDELFAILEIPGSGYLLGCNSWSDAGPDKTEPPRGEQDFWLIRIDQQGNKLWDKTIGGSGYDQINDLARAPDGNVYLSGGTVSAGSTGDLSAEPSRGGMDFWLGKINLNNGQLLWDHRYGGTGEDYAYVLYPAGSGALYLGGRSGSAPAAPGPFNNGKDAPFYGGDSDYWLLELDANGQKIREWSFGGTGLDDLYAVHENPLGQLVLGGVSDSGISGAKTAAPRGNYDYWLVGLDGSGNESWQRSLGGTSADALTKIAFRPDGSFVVGGHSSSNTGFEKTENNLGVNDFWVLSFECGLKANIVQTGIPTSCGGDPILLDAAIDTCLSCNYLWNTGAATSGIEVPANVPAAYSVAVHDEWGCVAFDTLRIEVPPPPEVELGISDTIIIQGSSLLIGSGNAGGQYLWSTGDTTPVIRVSQSGVYSVTVTDAAGCSAVGQVRVQVTRKGNIYVPNAFSPDLDGYNDYVSIFADESVRRVVTFQVADRWGTLVFRRDDFPPLWETEGWDGVYRGQPAPPGVYGWFAEIEYIDGVREVFEGSITVVR
jgi:gliding motility-associated-like protein